MQLCRALAVTSSFSPTPMPCTHATCCATSRRTSPILASERSWASRYTQARSGIGAYEGLYWRYETAIKRLEKAARLVVAATAPSTRSVARSMEPMRADALSDFVNPLQIVRRGIARVRAARSLVRECGEGFPARVPPQGAHRQPRLACALDDALAAESAAATAFSRSSSSRTSCCAGWCRCCWWECS